MWGSGIPRWRGGSGRRHASGRAPRHAGVPSRCCKLPRSGTVRRERGNRLCFVFFFFSRLSPIPGSGRLSRVRRGASCWPICSCNFGGAAGNSAKRLGFRGTSLDFGGPPLISSKPLQLCFRRAADPPPHAAALHYASALLDAVVVLHGDGRRWCSSVPNFFSSMLLLFPILLMLLIVSSCCRCRIWFVPWRCWFVAANASQQFRLDRSDSRGFKSARIRC